MQAIQSFVKATMRMIIVAAAFALAASVACAASGETVKIDTGLVSGVVADGVESFKGVPFAAPPVGALRWRAPQPPKPWTGVRVADHFGPMCMQSLQQFGRTLTADQISEDCLTLNVFRPEHARNLPVMVWIYGGGLTAGASSLPVYDGGKFARGGVILVSINYRLGSLGVFAHPALTAENADGGRLGNYAIMDQIAALEWVRRNIKAFGGDPNNVTIFGESAGGLSVNALMVSPEARGLFQRAIAESGYGRGHFSRMRENSSDGRPAAETEGVELATALGVRGNDLAALRALPAMAIIDYRKPAGYLYFILDGKVLTDDMWATFRAGKEAPVPFMLGSNSHEFPGGPWKDHRQDLAAFVKDDDRDALAKAYGGAEALDDNLMSDFLFTQQARALARLHTRNGFPTYVYEFSVVLPEEMSRKQGASHADELPYVFGNLTAARTPITGAGPEAVSMNMNAAWRAFAMKGNPNGPGLPEWPRYDGEHILEFTLTGTKAHPDERNGQLDALSKVVDPKS
jgi:para-nitrobenzyl esterase